MYATTWMNAEDTILSEITQSSKDKYYTYIKYLEQSNSQREEVEGEWPGAEGRGNEKLLLDGFYKIERVLVAQQCECTYYSSALKNGEDGKFNVMCIFPQFQKNLFQLIIRIQTTQNGENI